MYRIANRTLDYIGQLDGVEDAKGVNVKSPDDENASNGFKRIAGSDRRLG